MYNYSEKKSVVIVDKNIPNFLAINAVAHMAFAMGAKHSDDLGASEHYLKDAKIISGITKYPHIIKKATGQQIKNVCNLTYEEEDVSFFVFTDEMLQTGHDDELVTALNNTTFDAITIYAAIIYGKTEIVDKYTKKFSLFNK